MKKKTVQRLLIFFVGLPVIIGLVFLLPHYNHLALNLLAIIFSALGAAEFSVLLGQKNLNISKWEAMFLGALPPAVMFFIVRFDSLKSELWISIVPKSELLLSITIAAVVSWLLLSRIFARGDLIDHFLNRLAAGFSVLLYPGMLMIWLVRMSHWGDESLWWKNHASVIILVFLTTVFCTDGTAWLTGKLFGKGNQGIVPVSPKKSVAGFIGGICASIIVGTAAIRLFPAVFTLRYPAFPGAIPLAGSLLGMLTGIAAAFGDLGESAIKRSSGIKDSGHLIPGRGGILDSIDSIIFAAPVYYVVFSFLFQQP